MKNSFLFFISALLIQVSVKAQVKIGDNPTTLNSASLLELETTDKGFVPPRVSLTDVTSSLPLPAGLLTGTVVYNTNAAMVNGDGVGLYLWNGIAWAPVTTRVLTQAAWGLAGNAGTNYAANFIGTIDKAGFRMRTNNIQRMLIDSIGDVGIGSEAFDPFNRERLLVDYGATSSNTIAAFRGNVNNYLQINLQNTNGGGRASSDFVATANDGTDSTFYVDMGINSSAYNVSPENWGGPHDAYFYSNSRNLLLGTQADSSDVIFLLGGGQKKNNTVLQLKGPSGAVVVGRGEGTDSTKGSIVRGPNANINGGDIAGGDLIISGGRSTGNVKGANLTLKGGAGGLNGADGGSVIIDGGNGLTGKDGPVLINVSSSTGNIKIGGDSNNVIFPKFSTAGGFIYTARPSGEIRSTATEMTWDSIHNRLGIGTIAPANKLSIIGTDPLYLSGLQNTATLLADSLLTISNGVVKKTPYGSLSASGGAWALIGNSGTDTSVNFLGTRDNNDLIFRTNNTRKMTLGSGGNLGIGITVPPNKLSVLGTNPLYLSGVQATTTFTTDSILTINAGVVKKTPYSSLAGSISAIAPLTYNSTTGVIAINKASTSADGYLSSTDWNTFNNKVGSITLSVPDIMFNNPVGFTVSAGAATGALSLKAQTANFVFAGPASGVAATPTFRTLVAADIPSLATKYIQNQTAQQAASNFNISGSGTIGTNLSVTGTSTLTGAVTSNAGITNTGALTSSGGIANINAGSSFATNLNTGTSTSNVTIGNSANNILFPKFNTIGGLFFTSAATGQIANTAADMTWDDVNDRLGIGITVPPNKLSVFGANPLYLSGVQATLNFNADSILTINAGVVKKAPYSSLPGGGGAWTTTGNTGLSSSTNFIGTTNGVDFAVRTNNVERMRILSSTGNIGINTNTPSERLHVVGNFYITGAIMPGGNAGTAGQVLTSAGNGLSPTWQAPSGGGGSGWLITGNNNVNSSNFVGTIDPNVPLVFKVGGVQAGYLGASSSEITLFGVGASAGGQQATAFGAGAQANQSGTVAIGYKSNANSQNAIAIGPNASTSTNGGIAMGSTATASSQNGIAIGSGAQATTNPNTLAVGTGAKATGQNSMSFGNNASAPNIGAEAFGNSAAATGANSLVVGNNSTSSGNGAISIGDASTAGGTNAIVLGNNSSVAAVNNSIVLGTNSSVLSNANNTILIGDNLSTTQSNVLILGNSSKTVGISTTTPNAAAKLDVNGPFKLGVNGSVIDNIIKTTITTDSVILISKNGTIDLAITGAIVRIGATVIVNPRARNPRNRALPNTVAIGYAYVSARDTVTIDFITNDNGNATIPAGTKFDITIIQ